jgi:hypothetical protein
MLTWSLGCAPDRRREVRDHLVGVHVRGGARAGLEHVDRELVVELAGGDAVGGGGDPLGELGSSRPSSALTRAAAPLIRPSQRITGSRDGSPEIGKLATALVVSPPHSCSLALHAHRTFLSRLFVTSNASSKRGDYT